MKQNTPPNSMTQAFLSHRDYLLSFAFRMTGSLQDAEDIIQEVFLEAASTSADSVDSPKSWLTKVCSNTCIDFLRKAHHKRETYPGTWLPDAVPDSFQIWESLQNPQTAEERLINSESLSTSFLLLLEQLNPEERAIFLLAEVFNYSFREIAELLERTEASCRKIAQRARESIDKKRTRFDAKSVHSVRVLENFFEAAKYGDRQTIENLLAKDSEFYADGGGKVPASVVILHDVERISNFFSQLGRLQQAGNAEMKFEFTEVNGLPGLIISKKMPDLSWVFETIMSFEFSNGKIARIYAQRNPDKLNHLLRG